MASLFRESNWWLTTGKANENALATVPTRFATLAHGRAEPLKRIWVAIVALSTVVQIIFLILLPQQQAQIHNADYDAFYAPVARNLLDGHGYVLNNGFATTYPPGFPIFIAADFYLARQFGVASTTAIVACNVVLTSVGTLLVFLIANNIFDLPVALLGAALWILCPFNLWLMKQPNSEVPFVALLYLAIFLFIRGAHRNKSAVLIGVALGVAALIRPIGILLGVIFAAGTLITANIALRKRVMHAVLLLAGFILAVLPWELVVFHHTQRVILLSTNGPATMLDGLTFLVFRDSEAWVPVRVREMMKDIAEHGPHLRTTGDIANHMLQQFERNPTPVLELAGCKALRSWFATQSGRDEYMNLALQAVYLSFAALGFVHVCRARSCKERPFALFLTAIIAYFWIMATFTYPLLRYMVPAMGPLLMFSAAGAFVAIRYSTVVMT